MQGPNDSEKLQSDLNVHQKWEKSGIWSLIHPSVKSCTLRDLVTLSGTIIPCTDRPLNRLRMLGIEASTYPGISSVSLGFPHHINRITSNAQKTLVFSMKRNIKTTNSGIREAAYKTIVRPQIEYAFTTWSSYTKKKKKKKNIYKVEMVQRRSILWICNSYSNYDSVSAMQSDFGFRSLEQRRVDASVIVLYKIIHDIAAISLLGYFEQLYSTVTQLFLTCF